MSKPPVVELSVSPQLFVDDLCRIDRVGAVSHLVFTSTRQSIHGDTPERIVEVRLVVPNECLVAMGRAMLAGRVDPGERVGTNGVSVTLN